MIPKAMRIALIGDIHVYTQRLSPRRYLMSRRILGHTNLMLTRRRRFNHTVLEHVVQRVEEITPDMVLFSGDVTTTSLEDEFHDVSRYIRPMSEKYGVVLVPGNHDRYTFGSRRVRRIETLMAGIIPDSFPDLRPLHGGWKLLALDSAAPRVLTSSGELGRRQFEATALLLEELGADDGLVVLCHYPVVEPPLTPRHRSHDLKERDALRDLLTQCPARVVFLHGHVHKPWALLPGPPRQSPFISINAGAPCLTGDKYPLGQGFWQIDLGEDPHAPIGLVHHVPMSADGSADRSGAGVLVPLGPITWQSSRVV